MCSKVNLSIHRQGPPIKNGITKLVLTGTGAGKGAKLSVTMEGGRHYRYQRQLLGQALHPSVL